MPEKQSNSSETGRREVLERPSTWTAGDEPDASLDGRRSVLRRTGMLLFASLVSVLTLGRAEASWIEHKCVDQGCRTHYPCTAYQRVCFPTGCDSWEWDGCCGSC